MTEKIILGGGCFWCIEAVYRNVKGIKKAISGYMGGNVENPTYEQVCRKNTGHIEVVLLEYDPEVISVKTILDIFWTVHDPTTPDRQGNDRGPQYASAIFYYDAKQLDIIQTSIKNVASKIWQEPVVTKILPVSEFYIAEAYHQDYFYQNPNQAYCQYIIDPKITKLRNSFAQWLK